MLDETPGLVAFANTFAPEPAPPWLGRSIPEDAAHPQSKKMPKSSRRAAVMFPRFTRPAPDACLGFPL
jgi:hypothetical protein